MNISVSTPSQLALLVLTSALFFIPVSASALTSSGADGIFQPSTSMSISTAGQQIFNYTDIYIPSGVTIDLTGPTASLPFMWLATGNIDIAGVINIGAGNSLWIETPNSISVSGSLNLLDGSSIALISNAMTVSGGTLSGGTLSGGTLSGGTLSGGTLSGGTLSGGTLSGGTLSGGTLSGGTLSGGTLPSELGNISVGGYVSGGDIPVDLILPGGNISGGNILILSPVPEPDVWAMLFLGLFALFFASRTRNHNNLA